METNTNTSTNINTNITITNKNSNIGKNIILDSFYEELNEHKFFGIIIAKTMNISSEKLKSRIVEILKILNSEKINSYNLKRTIFEGLPDDIPSLRSLTWKILLNYLSENVNEWEETIDKKRNEYNERKKEIFGKLEMDLIKKRKIDEKNKEVEILDGGENINNTLNNITSSSISTVGTDTTPPGKKILKKKNTLDHPLSMTQNSKWKSYFNDLDLLEEIDKDVRRTRTHMHFFFMPAKTQSNTNIITNEKITEMADKKRNDPGSERLLNSKNSFETNADVMCRILFMFGKKYPQVRYVQGMNEILAPIYYAFSSDQNPYFYLNLEADSYICFENLMNEIQDIFIRSKDNTETGIQTRIKNLNMLLKIVDKDVYSHFIEEKVEIQYFVFRWYTLFLTQEFEMPDIMRIWDSILSEDDKFEFLNMICLAIIKIRRTEVLQSDFAGIMLSLQNIDKIDIEKLLKAAENIRIELKKNTD
jgi:hypothetical protein